jgi:hypothetical protein
MPDQTLRPGGDPATALCAGRSAESVDAEPEVVVPDGFADKRGHHQQTRSLHPVRHLQVADVQWTQGETLYERRDACISDGVVAGDEDVQRAAPDVIGVQDVAEEGVERLDDVRSRGGDLGGLLRGGAAGGGDELGAGAIEGVRDVATMTLSLSASP